MEITHWVSRILEPSSEPAEVETLEGPKHHISTLEKNQLEPVFSLKENADYASPVLQGVWRLPTWRCGFKFLKVEGGSLVNDKTG